MNRRTARTDGAEVKALLHRTAGLVWGLTSPEAPVVDGADRGRLAVRLLDALADLRRRGVTVRVEQRRDDGNHAAPSPLKDFEPRDFAR